MEPSRKQENKRNPVHWQRQVFGNISASNIFKESWNACRNRIEREAKSNSVLSDNGENSKSDEDTDSVDMTISKHSPAYAGFKAAETIMDLRQDRDSTIGKNSNNTLFISDLHAQDRPLIAGNAIQDKVCGREEDMEKLFHDKEAVNECMHDAKKPPQSDRAPFKRGEEDPTQSKGCHVKGPDLSPLQTPIDKPQRKLTEELSDEATPTPVIISSSPIKPMNNDTTMKDEEADAIEGGAKSCASSCDENNPRAGRNSRKKRSAVVSGKEKSYKKRSKLMRDNHSTKKDNNSHSMRLRSNTRKSTNVNKKRKSAAKRERSQSTAKRRRPKDSLSTATPGTKRRSSVGIFGEDKNEEDSDDVKKKNPGGSSPKKNSSECKTKFGHIIVNFLVICAIGGFYYSLFVLYNWVPAQLQERQCSSDLSIPDNLGSALCLLLQYLIPIVFFVANLILPFIFELEAVRDLEEYEREERQILMSITRRIFVRLVPLFVTGFTLYNNVHCDYQTNKKGGHGKIYQACQNELDETCFRPMCWETMVGQEFYKLTVFDTLTQAGTFLIKAILLQFKKFHNLEFEINSYVLDGVYSQTICWMGVFFTPLITLLTLLKFIFIFSIRKLESRIINSKKKKEEENQNDTASARKKIQGRWLQKSLHIILLVSLWLTVIPLTVTLNNTIPSNSCGPYKGRSTFFGVVTEVMETWGNFGDFVFRVMQPAAMYAIFAGLIILTYVTWVMGSAYRDAAQQMKIKEKKTAD